jgi:multisubunit Na+/H+ antiporter MnhE subunit
MTQTFRTLVRIIVGAAVFVVWLQLVGNPHVVETIIGLVIAIATGWWVGRLLSTKKY